MARLGAGGTDLLEGSLDVARDPALGIEVETEIATGRDDCDGDQAEQNFLHSVNSGSSREKNCQPAVGRCSIDGRACPGLLTGIVSDVASKRLDMLHIQLDLPDN